MHIGRVHVALDDVQDGDVAALLAGYSRHHAILGLQQSSHHVENRRLAHRLGLFHLVASERRVRRHQEVASRSRDQRGEDADQVVVHVAGVSEGGCAGGHDGRYELVRLLEGWLLYVQSIGGNV